MGSMREVAKGFTLIEISIFLAVTGALFAAVTIGVQNSIYQQRYNDTIQDFADFLGGLYSEVANVQSDGNGRHDKAMYGKLVTFGETVTNDAERQSPIHVYDVVADAANSWDRDGENDDTLGQLEELDSNVVLKEDKTNTYRLAGIVKSYTPKWGAKIQKASGFEDFEGSLLIIRNPKSGTIQTFAMDDIVEVKNRLEGALSEVNVFEYGSEDKNYLTEPGKFGVRDMEFCVNPNGDGANKTRTSVKLIAGAHDSSGVEILSFDNDENNCNL